MNSTSINKDSLKHLCKTCTKRRVGTCWHYCDISSDDGYICNELCKIIGLSYLKEYPKGLRSSDYKGDSNGEFPATISCTKYTKDNRIKE